MQSNTRARGLLAAIAVAAALVPAAASAQSGLELTIRPRGDGFGSEAYVGPYGRSLPGVQMMAGRPFGVPSSKIRLPTNTQIINQQIRTGPIGIIDGWHGRIGEGLEF